MCCSARDQEGELQCEVTRGPAQRRRRGTKAGLVILSEKLRGIVSLEKPGWQCCPSSLEGSLVLSKDSEVSSGVPQWSALFIRNAELILNVEIWMQGGLMRAQNPQQRSSKVIHTNRFPVIDFGTCPVHSPVHFQSNYKQSGHRVNQFIQSHLDCDKPASVA